MHQVPRGAPLAGVLIYRYLCQALKGASLVGSYFVVQCIRCLMGQPLYCSAADAGMWGKRGYGDGSTRYEQLSSVTFPWLPGFPPQAFPTRISSLTAPCSISPQSTFALALGLLYNHRAAFFEFFPLYYISQCSRLVWSCVCT